MARWSILIRLISTKPVLLSAIVPRAVRLSSEHPGPPQALRRPLFLARPTTPKRSSKGVVHLRLTITFFRFPPLRRHRPRPFPAPHRTHRPARARVQARIPLPRFSAGPARPLSSGNDSLTARRGILLAWKK